MKDTLMKCKKCYANLTIEHSDFNGSTYHLLKCACGELNTWDKENVMCDRCDCMTESKPLKWPYSDDHTVTVCNRCYEVLWREQQADIQKWKLPENMIRVDIWKNNVKAMNQYSKEHQRDQGEVYNSAVQYFLDEYDLKVDDLMEDRADKKREKALKFDDSPICTTKVTYTTTGGFIEYDIEDKVNNLKTQIEAVSCQITEVFFLGLFLVAGLLLLAFAKTF